MNHLRHEHELIQRLTNGDRQAWAIFVDRYSGLVYSRVQQAAAEFQFPLDSSDCEDLCADVFAALLANNCRSLRGFQGKCKLSTWLATIARRICLRRLARRRPRPMPPVGRDSSMRVLEPSTSESSDALQHLIRDEEREGLHVALAKLKPADRQILTLFFIDGLKYEEIGRRMKISVNTVGPKLQRAQRRLKRILETPHSRPPNARFR